jgi:hypothetical protein
LADEEAAEEVLKIPEQNNFGIRLLAEALNKTDDALELFERHDPNTSQYA